MSQPHHPPLAVRIPLLRSPKQDEDSALLPIARADLWRNLKLTLKHEDVRSDFQDIWSFRNF